MDEEYILLLASCCQVFAYDETLKKNEAQKSIGERKFARKRYFRDS